MIERDKLLNNIIYWILSNNEAIGIKKLNRNEIIKYVQIQDEDNSISYKEDEIDNSLNHLRNILMIRLNEDDTYSLIK